MIRAFSVRCLRDGSHTTGTGGSISPNLASPWMFTSPPNLLSGASDVPNPPPDPAAAHQLMMMMSAASYGQFAFLPGTAPGPGPSGLVLPPGAHPPPIPQIVKETIQLQGATMQPPNPGQAQPPTRERPPGCRTIFVGGIPEKTTEEHLKELFQRCGEIHSLRMSKKNFAHIRFVSQDCVDRALYFSGYRLKVEDRSEKEFCGKLHVDFAQARDDQYEFECAQRALMREQRHRNRSGSASPTEHQHYSEHEAAQLLEKLKVAETLAGASVLLTSWLEKGECCKKSSTQFYSMIASVKAHVRRLIQEKQQFDTDLSAFKEKHKEKLQTLMTQFSQIEKVFRAAKKQRNWDHFTKAQRKNLDLWLKQAEDIRRSQENEMLKDRQEENMETSDDEESGDTAPKRLRLDESSRLDEELESTKAELERMKQIAEHATNEDSGSATQASKIPDNDAKLIATLDCMLALSSGFLNIHPNGATPTALRAYLTSLFSDSVSLDLLAFLQRYPELFKFESEGVWKLKLIDDMLSA